MQNRLKWVFRIVSIGCIFFTSAAGAWAQSDAGVQWQGDPATIAAVEILVRDPSDDVPDWTVMAQALLGLRPGDTLDADGLEEAVRNLAPLAQVQTGATMGSKGVHLTFQVTPYRLIKTIDVSGNYPLLEREVRLVMAVAAGDVFRAETMPEQEASVARRFRDEGYIDPRVKIAWERRADGHYHLQVDIRKGPHYIMEEVRLNGNHGIGDASLKARMSTWRRSVFGLGKMRFTDRLLQDDVRRLVELYRSRGFADVVIEAETVASGPDNRRIACVLNIQEGPRYRIEFSGNQAVSDRRLRRELVLFESGNRGNIGLRRAANQMRRLYQEAGFPDAQVRWRENAGSIDPEALREIVFDIEEGQRHIVRGITITGNDHIGEQAVRRQMLTRPPGIFHKGVYESELLREDVTAVETLYLNEGYLNIRVNESVEVDPQTADVQIDIQIDEGPRTLVAQVAIEGDSPVPEESLRQDLRLRPDAPYTDFSLDDDKNTLSARISPRGYPHVDVRSEALMSSDRTRADVRHTITPGPHVLVGDIFFFGNFKTREKFMRRELGLESGENFALGSILEGQRRLRDLGIFESVQVHTIGLREKEDTVHLLVRTLEQEPYFLLAGLGYQTDRGFYGRAGIGDRNFSGTAKDVWLSGEISQVGYRVDVGIAEPRLLGSVIRAESAVFIERSEPLNQDFGTRTRGARISFSRAWRETWSAGLGLRYERREQFVRDEAVLETVDDPDAFEPRGIVVTTPSVLYDSRDSFIRPSRGQLASVAVDVSKGLDNTLDDFLKYRFEARTYHALGQRVVLAGRFWAGYVDPYGSDEVPLDQLFYLGGAATVRGFAENTLRSDDTGSPSGGRLALAAGLETRIEIGSNFELTPFVDTGSVRLSPTELGSDSLRWSAGLGFQYLTPIGPIGVFYGHKLDRREGEGAGRWHISVGYTF